MSEREMLVGLADRIGSHYEKHARDWDADRQSSMWNDKPWHDRFIANLAPQASVLDLGCGAGAPVARHMVQSGLDVVGVDASPTLISLCRERMPGHEWMVGDMRRVALGREFAGILAWDSFFHLTPDDQRGMFRVFKAHAGPGATLMFNAGPTHGERVGSYRNEPLYHASLDGAEYEELLARYGFDVVEHRVEDWENGGGRTVWLARCRRQRPVSGSLR